MNVLNVLLAVGAMLLWIMSMASLSDLHGSDAAGNGLAAAFGMLASIALWIALLVLLLFSAIRGAWPAWTRWAALILFPACAVASFLAIGLLNSSFYKAKWPLVVPGVAPVLMIVYAVWALYPTLQRALPAVWFSATVWGAILILSLVVWPEYVYRARHGREDQAKAEAEYKASEPQRVEVARQESQIALNKLDDKTPLRDWLEFTGPENELRGQAFEKIRHLTRRQADAEILFRQGFTYLQRDLPELDLQATPPVCEGSIRYFREKLGDLRPRIDNPPPFAAVQEFIQPYMPGLRWMVEHRCDCGAVLDELESAVRRYEDSPERRRFLEDVAALRAAQRSGGR